MRAIEYETGEPFELDPQKVESVEPRVEYNTPADGKTTGVVVLTMASGRQHIVLVDIWDTRNLESNEILDHWAAIVADEEAFCARGDLPARTFRRRIVEK